MNPAQSRLVLLDMPVMHVPTDEIAPLSVHVCPDVPRQVLQSVQSVHATDIDLSDDVPRSLEKSEFSSAGEIVESAGGIGSLGCAMVPRKGAASF